MTTAQLSVGIDTSAAKESLKQLRAELGNQPHNLLINVDPTSIDRDIQRYLKQRTFRISADTKGLGREIANDVGIAIDNAFKNNTNRVIAWSQATFRRDLNYAIDGVFNDVQRRLRFDGLRLSNEIREAVAAGTANVNIKVGSVSAPAGTVGTVGQAPTLGPDLNTVVLRLLSPAINELTQAALAVASIAKKAGLKEVGAGPLRAAESISVKDPVTGFTKRATRPLEEPALVVAEAQVANQQKADAAFQAKLAATKQRLLDQRLSEVGKEEQNNLKELVKKEKEINAFRTAIQNQKLSEIGRLENEALRAEAKHEADVLAFRTAINNQKIREIGKSENEAQKAQAKQEADVLAFRTAINNQKLKEIGKSETEAQKEQAKQEASALAFRTAINNQKIKEIGALERAASAEETALIAKRKATNTALVNQRLDEIAQIEKKELADRRNAIIAFYAKAKADAAATYSGQGPAIAAARATQRKFGTEETLNFLGPSKQYLLDSNRELEKYERGTKSATISTRIFGNASREAHALTRGFAGSLGALWTTYGSPVPLIAAAAIGASLRGVVSVGKDVEYQLAFVSAISDNTAVSLTKFGEAIKGSLVTPLEASQALRGLAQNGLSVGESLRALPVILSLATAGELSLTEAALGATGVLASFGLGVEDLARVSDVFAKAAAISNTSVASMVESMKQASQVGDQFGVTLEETAAALATLAQRNITGSAAGTAFRNFVSELAAPTEKARRAMKQLGLELYDSNKQLLPFEVSLQRLRDKIITLDEQSRITVLRDIFNERGDKAANAIVTDLDLYKKQLGELKNEAKDFTKSVTDALGETTQGKIKKLTSELQSDFVEAFNGANSALGAFVNDLRILISSDEFKSGLQSLVNGAISVTRAFADNFTAVRVLITAYAGFKGLQFAVSLFSELRLAVAGLSTLMLGAGVATATLLNVVTGGVVTVLSAAAAYLLLRDNTSEAQRAQEAYADKLRLSNSTLDASISRIEEENTLLQRQTELLYQGVDAIKARQLAEGELKKNEVVDVAAKLEEDKQLLARNKQKQSDLIYDNGKERLIPRSGLSTLRDEAKALENSIAEGEIALTKLRRQTEATEKRDLSARQKALAEQVSAFNKDLSDKNSLLKVKIKVEPITSDFVKNNPINVVQEELEKRKAEVNKSSSLNSYKREDLTQQRIENAEVGALLKSQTEAQASLKQQIAFRKQLEDAKYDPSRFGTYIASVLAEQRQIEETTKLLDLQRTQVQELEKAKAGKDEPERIRLKSAQETLEAEVKRNEAQLAQYKELARIKASVLNIDAASRREREQSSVTDFGETEKAKIRNSYKKKELNPAEAARQTAELAVEEKFRPKLTDAEEAINKLLQGRLELQESELENKELLLAANEANLAIERANYSALKSRISDVKKQVGEEAKFQYESSQTAEAGWNRFWEQYRDNADSSAKQVEGILKTTTQGMTDSFVRFAETGKISFRGLISTILQEQLRLQATKANGGIFSFLANTVGSLFSSGVPTGGSGISLGGVSSGSGGSIYSLAGSGAKFANGGIMTEYGSLPLRKYSDGGIARSPQAAIYGEGSKPEAYVPLPDGRSIPVMMMENNKSSGSTNVSVSVSVASDGKSKVESDTSGEKGAQLSRMFEAATMEVIAREKRPGGLLYSR